MDEDELPDLSGGPRPGVRPEPDRGSDGVNHLAYILLALVVMLVFWIGTG
jgi:hypothetical protein